MTQMIDLVNGNGFYVKIMWNNDDYLICIRRIDNSEHPGGAANCPLSTSNSIFILKVSAE